MKTHTIKIERNLCQLFQLWVHFEWLSTNVCYVRFQKHQFFIRGANVQTRSKITTGSKSQVLNFSGCHGFKHVAITLSVVELSEDSKIVISVQNLTLKQTAKALLTKIQILPFSQTSLYIAKYRCQQVYLRFSKCCQENILTGLFWNKQKKYNMCIWKNFSRYSDSNFCLPKLNTNI